MIRLEGISKEFPDKVLFDNTSLIIKPGMRIGLVGPNGSGKTTLLRLMLGEESVDSGNVLVDKGTVIGYLPQDIIPGSDRSILEEVMQAYPMVAELEEKIYTVSQQVAVEPDNQKLLNRLSNLQEDYERMEGWSLEDRAARILNGLGFSKEQFHRPLEVFSGGWRMRVVLAGILLLDPDMLFLDEPTNHLDLDATIWLETFLAAWQGGLVMISHDRSFLDTAVTHIVEIDQAMIVLYSGNYSYYREQKQLRREQQEAAYRNQQRKIASTERFIERFRYKNTKARQVQSRIKQLEKMELVAAPTNDQPQLRLSIPQPGRAPLKVADLKAVRKQYDDLVVYHKLDLTIERGQKIGLVGRNGAGKSTLLKMLAGETPITAGQLYFGAAVKRAYFAQHQLEILDPNKTVYTSIESIAGGWTISQIRGYLGGFLFPGETVDKLVKVLSGGEKSRLALARMLVEPTHLLLLDEPTNHLDMVSRDVVERVLADYQGTLICISHDRHFLNTVTNTTIDIHGGGIKIYSGNYDYYYWKSGRESGASIKGDEESFPTDQNAKQARISDRKERRKLENEYKKLTREMKVLEKDLVEQTQIIKDPSNTSNYQVIQQALLIEERLEKEYLDLLERTERIEQTLANG
ncbi:MAG: ABC-F family ATP-binding cassette domain-containing protein [Candidatus Marinimicrobia bacterium]|nr:ABC-F family ATP-binding cassette domain-containing protein [Candidatus Neomarinimicrobiota bacterium]